MSRLIFILTLLVVTSCTRQRAVLGTAENPIKLFFVPSVDLKVIEDSSKKLKDYLESQTNYKFEVSIPQNYIAVVEAFGTSRADIAALNTFGYILAHDKYQVQAFVTVLRHGSSTYQSQFIARTAGSVKKIEDLKGKKIAFVDPASTSGYLLPLKMLKDKSIVPSESVFAMKHDNVVSMVYNGQVDGGATFYSPPEGGVIEDARKLVKTQYPDVEQKISIIQLSDPIPNDPIVFRKDLPEDMKTKITDVFMSYIKTEDGKKAFKAIYGVDDLKLASDKDYDSVRTMLKSLGKSAQEMIK
jgi:phosphonate transport system substrate-binding protein